MNFYTIIMHDILQPYSLFLLAALFLGQSMLAPAPFPTAGSASSPKTPVKPLEQINCV